MRRQANEPAPICAGSDALAQVFSYNDKLLLRQLVEILTEALETYGKADALLGRLENDESRGLPAAQLLEQIVIHHHFGNAAVGQAAHESGAADVDLVDLEPEAGR